MHEGFELSTSFKNSKNVFFCAKSLDLAVESLRSSDLGVESDSHSLDLIDLPFMYIDL